MLRWGITLLLGGAAAAAGAYEIAVGPAFGWGTAGERNVITAFDAGGVPATADAGGGPLAGAAAVFDFASPWAASLVATYATTATHEITTWDRTKIGDDTWRVAAGATYAFENPPLAASLEFGYKRFDVTSETGADFGGPEWYPREGYDYRGDRYELALLARPALPPLREHVVFVLAFGPTFYYLRREGEGWERPPGGDQETIPISYRDMTAEFVAEVGVNVSSPGGYGLRFAARFLQQLDELRREYPANAAGAYYVTASPYVVL